MTNSVETSTTTPKRKKTQYDFPLVEVMWMDAITHNGWLNVEDLQKEADPCLTTTVAFLIKERDDALFLASTYSGSETNAQITVPKGMLVSMRVLKPAKKEKKVKVDSGKV